VVEEERMTSLLNWYEVEAGLLLKDEGELRMSRWKRKEAGIEWKLD